MAHRLEEDLSLIFVSSFGQLEQEIVGDSLFLLANAHRLESHKQNTIMYVHFI